MTEKDHGQHFVVLVILMWILISGTAETYTFHPAFQAWFYVSQKTCIGQKFITENPSRIPSFQRVSSDHHGLFGLFYLYQWKIWNLYSSLTMNNGKLMWYFRSHLYAIVSDMAHFLILFGMRERNGLFRTVFYLYWCKIKTFGIFTAQWLWIMAK